MSKLNPDFVFKLLLIGDSDTGKSSMLLRYRKNKFEPSFITTIGIDFAVKYSVIDNKKIKTQIWDTAGQERFRTITTAYYRGSHGVILVYDITNRKTFESVTNWMTQLSKHSHKDVIIYLVGNKCDNEDKRCVSYEEGLERATYHGCKFTETSAKTGLNVSSTFNDLINSVYDSDMVRPQCSSDDILLLGYVNPENSRNKCCNI